MNQNQPILRNEVLRIKIGRWMFFLFVIAALFLYTNFTAGQIFFEISIAILGGNILLLVTLAVESFRSSLIKGNKEYFTKLKDEIQTSIKKELSIDTVEDKLKEYNNRAELYEYFSTRNKMSLIKVLLTSVFTSIGFMIIYAVFPSYINHQFIILTASIYLVNLALLFTFFYSLQCFLSAVVYVALNFYNQQS